jgi:hypothetical protein
MAKDTPQPISYNKQTPREIMMFTEMIAEVYSKIKNPTWSNMSNIEIGFSVRDTVSKSNLFLGIWYEAWEAFGIPLCMTLDYGGKAVSTKYNEIKRHLDNKNQKGLIFKNDYQEFALILFEHEYFNFINDEERLAILFNEMTGMLEIVNRKTVRP